MPNYPNQEIRWNDGEGVTSADLNAMQRAAKFRELDMLQGARARVNEWDATFTSGRLYSFGGGAVREHASAITVTNDPGVILCDDPTLPSDGSDGQLLAYRLAGGELQTTIATIPANPNNRIDLICVKLDYVDSELDDTEWRAVKDQFTGVVSTQAVVKRRRVRLQKQVVMGTPAPTPVEPAVPSGYCRWASVYVEWNQPAGSPFSTRILRDHRYPLGLVRTISWPALNAGGYVSEGGAGWTFDTTQQLLVSAANGNIVRVFPQAPGRHNARLLGVGCVGDLSGCTVELKRRYHDIGNTLVENNTAVGSSGFNGVRTITAFNSAVAQYNFHALTDGDPLWANGYTAGIATARANLAVPNNAEMSTVALKITANAANKTVRFVEWFWAVCQ